MRVFLAVPSYQGLTDAYGRARFPKFHAALVGTIKTLGERGHQVMLSKYEGCCYVQLARNELIKIFRDTDCDVLMFLDDDLEFDPKDVIRLVEMDDALVCGVYRRKQDEEDYPVAIHTNAEGKPIVRADGCIAASDIPTGFMRVKREVFDKLYEAYPQFHYQNPKGDGWEDGFCDYFPQGVHGGRWVGEDFAFCRLWREVMGLMWIVPNMTIHHYGNGKCYSGNYHEFLSRCPGGANDPTANRAVAG